MTRILLVDDDEDNLKIFTIILENQGFIVKGYSDPDLALTNFKPGQFDLIMLDYRMPKINGIELYKSMREIDHSARITLLTASHEQMHFYESQGIKEEPLMKVIRKPIGVRKLLEEVTELLNDNGDNSPKIIK